MDEWTIIAVLDCSCGNESVGEMWVETKSFPIDTPAYDILKWATAKKTGEPEDFRGNLRLTVGK